jgi:hypothetical protein
MVARGGGTGSARAGKWGGRRVACGIEEGAEATASGCSAMALGELCGIHRGTSLQCLSLA